MINPITAVRLVQDAVNNVKELFDDVEKNGCMVHQARAISIAAQALAQLAEAFNPEIQPPTMQ